MPEYLSLNSWRVSYEQVADVENYDLAVFQTRDLEPGEEIVDPAGWQGLLARFGGAPAHVGTALGLREASEIAVMLADDEQQITAHQALCGVALAICRAHARGRQINSLGFIAIALARCLANDERSWALDYPTILTPSDDETAMRWVEWALSTLRSRGIGYDAEQLRGTASKEHLWHLVQRFGQDSVQEGISEGEGPGENGSLRHWAFFDRAVGVAAASRKRSTRCW